MYTPAGSRPCISSASLTETSGSHPQFGYWGGSSDMAVTAIVYTRFQAYVHSLSSVKEKDRYMKTAFQKIGYVIANAVFSSRRS